MYTFQTIENKRKRKNFLREARVGRKTSYLQRTKIRIVSDKKNKDKNCI